MPRRCPVHAATHGRLCCRRCCPGCAAVWGACRLLVWRPATAAATHPPRRVDDLAVAHIHEVVVALPGLNKVLLPAGGTGSSTCQALPTPQQPAHPASRPGAGSQAAGTRRRAGTPHTSQACRGRLARCRCHHARRLRASRALHQAAPCLRWYSSSSSTSPRYSIRNCPAFMSSAANSPKPLAPARFCSTQRRHAAASAPRHGSQAGAAGRARCRGQPCRCCSWPPGSPRLLLGPLRPPLNRPSCCCSLPAPATHHIQFGVLPLGEHLVGAAVATGAVLLQAQPAAPGARASPHALQTNPANHALHRSAKSRKQAERRPAECVRSKANGGSCRAAGRK